MRDASMTPHFISSKELFAALTAIKALDFAVPRQMPLQVIDSFHLFRWRVLYVENFQIESRESLESTKQKLQRAT